MTECKVCFDDLSANELDADGLCEYCQYIQSACPRCKEIFCHDELGENSEFTVHNYPSCDRCLTTEERAKKNDH